MTEEGKRALPTDDGALQILLAAGHDPAFFDEDARHAFLRACKDGPTPLVAAFLQQGMQVHIPESPTCITCNDTAIVKAAEGGDLARIVLLQSYGASLDERDREGDTPLHTAANWKNVTLLRQLLQARANPNTVNKRGFTPLLFALHKEHAQVVDALLSGGADPNCFGGKDATLAPFEFTNDPAMVARLLKAGASPDCVDSEGTPLLFVYILRDRIDCAKLLLDAGAVDRPNRYGWTAWMYARANSNQAAVDLLVHAERESESDTAFFELLKAAGHGDLDRVKTLVAEGCPLDAINWNGETALFVATAKKHVDVVQFLVEKGANPTIVTKARISALTCAFFNDDYDLARLLLHAGAPIDERPGFCKSLHNALKKPATLQRIIEARPTIDCADTYGQTPLYLACGYNMIESAKLLLDAGASPDGSRNGEHIPLQIAAARGHAEIVRMLIKAGAEIDLRENTLLYTPLLSVCDKYNATDPERGEVALALLEAGADVMAVGRHQITGTPLKIAQSAKNQPCIDVLKKWLLDDKRETNSEVLTALIEFGEIDRAKDRMLRADPSTLSQGPRPPWIAALERNDPELAEWMLERGVDPKCNDGIGSLYRAIGKGWHPLVSRLLARGADPNESDAAPLRQAASRDDIDMMEMLAAAGAKLDLRRAGKTPLMAAARAGAIEAVRWLLARGADPNIRGWKGATALEVAREAARNEVVALLCQVTASDLGDDRGRTSLFYACMRGDLEAIRSLLAQGAKADHADLEGQTPRALASFRREVAMLLGVRYRPIAGMPPKVAHAPFHALLRGELDVGAVDVRARDSRGDSLLHVAVRRGDETATRALLDAGADVRAVNAFGESVWATAIACNPNEDLARLVLERGGKIDVNAQARVYMSIGEWNDALQAGDLQRGKRLLNEGKVPLDVVDSNRSPLGDAIGARDSELVDLLLRMGADPQVTCHQRAPITLAAVMGDESVVKSLLQTGVPLSPQGPSPLATAVQCGHVEVVRLLLDRGAPPSIELSHLAWPTARAAALTVALEREMTDWVRLVFEAEAEAAKVAASEAKAKDQARMPIA
jgi:ankyrin repeat protein